MELKKLNCALSVCKIASIEDIDYSGKFVFVGKTDNEISLVCETAHTPDKITAREDGWLGFRIEGQLDFSLIGILSKISSILEKNKIGIFAISTYDTDYILVKEQNYQKALEVLREADYIIVD